MTTEIFDKYKSVTKVTQIIKDGLVDNPFKINIYGSSEILIHFALVKFELKYYRMKKCQLVHTIPSDSCRCLY